MIRRLFPLKAFFFSSSILATFVAALVLIGPLVAHAQLDPALLSGPWGDPDRDGEGFVVEVYESGLSSIIWFTYPDDSDPDNAVQAWILGNGQLIDDVIHVPNAFRTSGLLFGEKFNPDNYQIEPWGEFTLRFIDESHAEVNYDGNGGSGSFDLDKLLPLLDPDLPTTLPSFMSGAWVEVDSDGEGFFIEMLSPTLAAVFWFTYDELGNQRWNLGVGQVIGSSIVISNSALSSGTSFGDGFVRDDIETRTFATIKLEFSGCDSGELRYLTAEGLVKAHFPIRRLTTLAGHACRALVVHGGEGGMVESASGENDCLEGQTCLIGLLANDDPDVTFTATPRSGHVFTGWQQGDEIVCIDEQPICTPDLSAVVDDATLTPVFESEGSIYFPPDGSVSMCTVDSLGSLETRCEIKSFESYGYGAISDYAVTDPAVLFVDVPVRRAELDSLPPGVKDNWCVNLPSFFEDIGIDATTYTATPPEDIWNDAPLNDFFRTVQHARLYKEYFDDPDATGLIVRSLHAYAQAGTWLNIDLSTDGENRHYNLGLHMAVYLLAWDAVREDPAVSAADRDLIDRYLYDLIVLITRMNGKDANLDQSDLSVDMTNHQWPRDVSAMMYGILTGNGTLFQLGIKRFFVILDGWIRPDGSHIYESQRAGAALFYSLGATSHMIHFAELAANQGYDLYTAEVNGVSLVDIIEFHLSALEDETILHPYSGDNTNFCEPGTEQCAFWNDLYNEEYGRPLSRGWPDFEVFRRRFPDSPLIERFQAVISDEEHVILQEGPFFQGCEFRDVGGS